MKYIYLSIYITCNAIFANESVGLDKDLVTEFREWIPRFSEKNHSTEVDLNEIPVIGAGRLRVTMIPHRKGQDLISIEIEGLVPQGDSTFCFIHYDLTHIGKSEPVWCEVNKISERHYAFTSTSKYELPKKFAKEFNNEYQVSGDIRLGDETKKLKPEFEIRFQEKTGKNITSVIMASNIKSMEALNIVKSNKSINFER